MFLISTFPLVISSSNVLIIGVNNELFREVILILSFIDCFFERKELAVLKL